MPAFVSQHTSAEIDGAISAIIGDTASPNGTTIVTSISGSEYVALWDAGTPKTITYANFVADIALESGLLEGVDDRVAALLTEGSNITLTYDDGANTLTVSVDAIDNTVIGGVTPTAGTFTNLTFTGTFTGSIATSNVTSGTFADARIAQSNVTQHQAALSITESQISDFGTYQTQDAGLTSIAGLTTAADKMLYTTASDTYAVTDLTSFARTILDDTSAAAVRVTIDVDQAGTDNSTDVTLSGSYNYLTLTGQDIALGQIDLTTDVTGALPSANIGSHTHDTADITTGTFADARIAETNVTQHEAALSIASSQISDKALANGVASLDGSGKVPSAQLPALALTDVFVVASQSAQLALTAQEGDLVIRTDESKTYVHNGGSAGTMADYTELQFPDAVTSVNSLTGTVVLDTDDVSEGSTNLYYTDVRADARISAAVLDDLSDVTETSITTGDVLRWSGTEWVNYADSNYAVTSHTHTSSDVTDFVESVDDQVATLLVGGTNVSLSYDDGAGTLTINSSAAAGPLNDVSDVTITSASTGDLLRYNGSAWVNYADSAYAAASHTHTVSNITDFGEGVDDQVATLLTAGDNITLTYDDAAGTLTMDATGGGGGGFNPVANALFAGY